MKEIDSYISLLLYNHECVIIPGFGGIVAQKTPSRFLESTQMMLPPSKKISFNIALSQNDGLLANEISVQKKISFDAALGLASDYGIFIKKELKTNGIYAIMGIGIFEQTSDSTIRFEPKVTTNFLKSSYGLQAVTAIKLNVEQPIENSDKKVETPIISIRNSPKMRLWQAAAVLPFIGYSMWLGTQTEIFSGKQFAFSDLNPFLEKRCKAYVPRDTEVISGLMESNMAWQNTSLIEWPKENEAGFGKLYLYENQESKLKSNKFFWVRLYNNLTAFAAEESTAVHTEKPAISAGNTVPTLTEKGEYHVITGCFGVKENAENFVVQLMQKGYKAYILDFKNGLYRVSVGGFANKEQALDTLPKLRETVNKDAWLVKTP
jgi:hypothetical protein